MLSGLGGMVAQGAFFSRTFSMEDSFITKDCPQYEILIDTSCADAEPLPLRYKLAF